eukprot:jgi/Botrbrau1/15052/Bobra.0297s0009.1
MTNVTERSMQYFGAARFRPQACEVDLSVRKMRPALITCIASLLLSCAFSFTGAAQPGLLHEAAINGDLKNVQAMIASLRRAQPQGQLSELTTCYAKPSNSSCFDREGVAQGYACSQLESSESDCVSVLDAAALGRQPTVINYLINEEKADPNAVNKAGRTALHYAFDSFSVYWHPCSEDFRQTVEALLSHGANPNIPFPYGGLQNYTVLHFEAYDGNRHGLIPALIAAGAHVDARDDRGLTPLMSASKHATSDPTSLNSKNPAKYFEKRTVVLLGGPCSGPDENPALPPRWNCILARDALAAGLERLQEQMKYTNKPIRRNQSCLRLPFPMITQPKHHWCDFRLSCDDCSCATNFCTDSQSAAACPSSPEGYTDNLQFFGAAPTIQYLVAKGADPNLVSNDGSTAIDYVPKPDNPANAADWVSGTCKKTYEYLKTLGL